MDSSSSLQASKVRKPYTITKQRERWTEEEHMKFLEALKLYGRAWRRIEEHIGTKTAVQIRSHAQKFFSKLVKGSSGRGISSDKLEDIEIPPPRPKKKPRHPYPRKATASSVNSNGSQVSKEVNSLPSVVASAPLLGDRPQQRAGFVPYNSKGRMPNHVNAQDGKLESSNTSNSSLFSLKLFGQTMLVSANEMPPTSSPIPASNASHGAFRKITPQHQGEDSSKSDPEDAVLERSETVNSQGLNLLEKLIANSAVDSGSVPSVGKICKRMDSSEEQVSSDMGTNSSCITRSQGSPSAVSSYPRHVPVQCVVDGNSTKNVSDNSKTCFNISPMPYSVTYNSGSLSNSEAISPWSATIPALFPWVQMQNGENAVAEAVAAATAAAASAWWSLYGALPSFYPQTMFSGIGGMEPPMECRKSSTTNIPETANNADPCDFTSKGFMSSTGKSSMKEADCENERSSNSSNTSSVDVAQDGLVVNAIVNKETGCPKRSHSNSAVSMFEAEESTDLETETEECSMSRKRCRLNEAEVEDEQNSSLKSQVSVNENPKSASNKDLHEFGAQISDENSLSAHEKFADNRIKQNSKKDGEGKNYAFCEDEVEAPETPSQKARLSNFSRVNSIENSENKLSQRLVEAVAKSRSGLGFVPYQRCSVEAYKEAAVKNAEIMKDENQVCTKQ